ncbi:MAG: hypothetical protein RMK16_02310 [Acidobacteriota bacterium]|nr:hypothetical protein [Acidobacteriota bacterium]
MKDRRYPRKARWLWIRGTAGLLAVGVALRVFLVGVAVYDTSAHTCGCSDGVCCCHPTSSVPRLEPCRWKGYPEAGWAYLTLWVEPSPLSWTPELLTTFEGGAEAVQSPFESPLFLPDPPPRTSA